MMHRQEWTFDFNTTEPQEVRGEIQHLFAVLRELLPGCEITSESAKSYLFTLKIEAELYREPE